jgi:hypothetical protein
MEYATKTTSAEVYAVIHAAHPDLVPFSSFSDPSGTFNGGPGETGRMDTEWGFSGAPIPLVGVSMTWRIVPEDPNKYDHKRRYWLCVPLEDR